MQKQQVRPTAAPTETGKPSKKARGAKQPVEKQNLEATQGEASGREVDEDDIEAEDEEETEAASTQR